MIFKWIIIHDLLDGYWSRFQIKLQLDCEIIYVILRY